MSVSKPSLVKGCLKKKNFVSFVSEGNVSDSIIFVDKDYVDVFLNDEDVRNKNQVMIIDIGCPRSLLGMKEYKRLLKSLSPSQLERLREYKASEKFRFGPSRTYDSWLKVEIPLDFDGVEIDASFFVVDGDVPILIGNDLLKPLGAIIYTETGVLQFSKLGVQIAMTETRGGHFVVPVNNTKNDMKEEHLEKV